MIELIAKEKDCEYCGRHCVSGEAHDHHLFKRSIRPDLIKDPNNIMTLCAFCHGLTHRSRKMELQLIEKFYGKTKRARNSRLDRATNGGNAPNISTHALDNGRGDDDF